MKRKLSLILTGIFILAQAGTAGAVEYALKTNLPVSSGVTIVATSITAAGVWSTTSLPDLNMDFGDLKWETGTATAPVNMWLGTKYFAVEISNVGAGAPGVTVSYAEGNKPSGATKNLGVKVVASVNKETYNPPIAGKAQNPTETLIWSKPLAALGTTGVNVPSSSLTGGWCRVYLGVYTGSPAVTGAEGFTNADAPGSYTGKVTITATTT